MKARVDPEPFRNWLLEKINGRNISQVVKYHGWPERRVRAVLNGEFESINLRVVDEVLVATGEVHMLEELYPLEGT